MRILEVLWRIWNSMFQLFWLGKKSLRQGLNVYIKSNTGSTLSLDLDPKWDIGDVKQLIGPKLGMPPQEVKIIFAGKELEDSTVIEECDLGEQTILHAVRRRSGWRRNEASEEGGSRPLSQTVSLLDRISESEDGNSSLATPDTSFNDPGATATPELSPSSSSTSPGEKGGEGQRHFYVYCYACRAVTSGKLRVRCSACKSGALTVDSDPRSWDDVLLPHHISAHCEHDCCPDGAVAWAEFYFKCAQHKSGGDTTSAAISLNLIKSNTRQVPCLACTDISDVVLVFGCADCHVTCLECFKQYCTLKLRERRFVSDPALGYTLGCPAGCPTSLITQPHHFKLLPENLYSQYQRFGAEEFVLANGGVLCPQPGCGAGIIPDDPTCTKITCINGCGFVFCRNCLQGYHLGECAAVEESSQSGTGYSVDPARASQARWDEASKVAIKVMTKPCPKCRTPTERAGGCMHMVCTRCSLEWCWVCQTEWTRNCMGNHWFG